MKKNRSLIVSSILLIVGIFLIQMISLRGFVSVVEKKLNALPLVIKGWKSVDIPMGKMVVKELDADVYLNRIYSKTQSKASKIALYIGYYGTQKGGRTGHNPNACLPSQGWTILEEIKRPVKLSVDRFHEQEENLIRLLVKLDGNKKLIYHWYQTKGGIILISGIQQNLNRFWSRIFYNRNDGAFIQVSIPVLGSIESAEDMVKEFVKELYPLLIEFWPIESESS